MTVIYMAMSSLTDFQSKHNSDHQTSSLFDSDYLELGLVVFDIKINSNTTSRYILRLC